MRAFTQSALFRTPLLMAVAALVVSSTACQQRTSARVSEIEVTNNENDNVRTSEITYNDDGTVAELEIKVNGAFDSRFETEYDSGVIEKITVVDDNDDPYDFEFTWEGALLVEVETDNQFYRATYDYDGDAPNTLEELERTYQYFDSTSLTEATEFVRNDEGQLVETKAVSTFQIPIFGDTITTIENEYDWDEGLLKGVTRSTSSGNNTDVDDFDFDYEDKGVFAGMVLSQVQIGGTEHEVTYDDQGRISEIANDDGNRVTTTRYTYEDGASNIIWEPAIPFNTLFDLNGKPFSSVELMTQSLLLGDF